MIEPAGEIRQSSDAVSVAAVLVCACLAPGLASDGLGLIAAPRSWLPSWLPSWVPTWLVAAVVTSALFEVLWRADIRPRLMWDAAGIAVLGPLDTRWIPWHDVATLDVGDGAVRLVTTDGAVVWRFDRFWWLEHLSARHRDRPRRHRERLLSTLAHARRSRPGGASEPSASETGASAPAASGPAAPTRPWWLLGAAVLVAIAAAEFVWA